MAKVLEGEIADDGTSTYIKWPQPEMPIARGQAVVAYLEDRVVDLSQNATPSFDP